jgi:serine/threonine-protein kinase
MPHLDGQTLAARLESGRLPLDQALTIAREIADALDQAHRHGITHRDLKPANIMLTKSGAKLLDFGLAKLTAPAGPISMSAMGTSATAMSGTAQGTLLGTLLYMAPEQVEGREAGARSDIWALGAVIYEMVTGTRPFQGETAASVIGAILKDNPPPVSRLQPVAPPLLDQIVTRCLVKDPDDRWQSARDLRTALGWVAEPTPPLNRPLLSPVRWVMAALALLAAGALGWFGASARAPATSPRAFSLEIGPPAGGEITMSIQSGQGGGSAVSPDGRTVAFVARVEGVPKLWVRSLDSITLQALPDTDDAEYPFWSPDGRSLGYFARGSLRRVDASGGASTSLTSVVEPRGGSWGADGTIVFCENVGTLQRITASGGTPAPLTTLEPGEVSHRWPRFLPDGRTLFFFVQGDRPGAYLTALDQGARKERVADTSVDAAYVPPRDRGPGHMLMIQGDSLFVQPFDLTSRRIIGNAAAIPGAGSAKTFIGANRSALSVANDGTIVYASGSNRYQMTWFDTGGNAVSNVGTPDRYVGLRLSPNGSEALALVDDAVGNRDTWRVELARGTRSRVTVDNRGNFAAWSPDGQRIVFSGLTRQTLFEKSASGDPADHALLQSDYTVFPSDWSSDGKYVLFTRSSPGNDVWALPMEGERKAVPIVASPAADLHGHVSPDGRFLAFTSNGSGRSEVYVQAFPSSETPQRVSGDGGGYPRWSRKGNELYFRSLDGRLLAAPIRYHGDSAIPGEPRFVMRLIEPPGLHPYPYDVAPDGRVLALTPVSGSAASISLNVLVNWQAALGR